MKHQISKVAIIATLAFIGVGFAGTQQAKAEPLPCPNARPCGEDTCNLDTYDTEAALGCKGYYDVDPTYTTRVSSTLCRDCDGVVEGADGHSPGVCVARWVSFNDDAYNKQGYCWPLGPNGLPKVGGFGSEGARKVGLKRPCRVLTTTGPPGNICNTSTPR